MLAALISGQTNPLGVVERYSYDNMGNLSSLTTRNGATIGYEYNARHERIKKTVPGVGDFTYQFDPVGNLIRATDPDSVIENTYDLLNRLLATSTVGSPNQPGVVLSFQYNLAGNRVRMDDPTGTTTYQMDALDRVISLKNSINQVWNWTFDAAGRMTSQANPNGTSVHLNFDNADQLLQIKHLTGVNPLTQFDYVLNPVGNRTRQTEAIGSSSRVRDFTYDQVDRLLSSSTVPESFSYDLVGNQKQNSQSHDAANRLLSDSEFTYQHDANGNLTRKTRISDGVITSYFWDSENRLIGVTTPSSNITYRYDSLRRRIEKSVNSVVTRYVYDGADLILEADGNNVLKTKYTYGAGIDRPLMREELDSSGQTIAVQVYHQDGNNNVVALTDLSGSFLESYEYSAFGKLSKFDASHHPITGPPLSSFTFTGREFDSESGLYFYRARYYDPSAGRFISEDPLGFGGGDANLLAYCGNNSINCWDPFGLEAGNFPASALYQQMQDGTYEALNNILLGFGPSTGNSDAIIVATIAGIVAPTPGGKLKAAKGTASLYDDVTRAGSRFANRATDVTKSQFEKNLIDSGFTRSLSKDGKAVILEKNGARYILRDGAKSTGGPTADFYKPGSSSIDLKIRLEGGTP
jgi:RHS repeat-associated protein